MAIIAIEVVAKGHLWIETVLMSVDPPGLKACHMLGEQIACFFFKLCKCLVSFNALLQKHS